jgi:hypothetical protein
MVQRSTRLLSRREALELLSIASGHHELQRQRDPDQPHDEHDDRHHHDHDVHRLCRVAQRNRRTLPVAR